MIKAKKYFGQNFLKDKNIIKQITQAIPKGIQNIIEIGPGLGDLTQELLKICRVKAYEIDGELIPFLKNKFKKQISDGSFELSHMDASEAFKKSLSEENYLLVANLPYYLASSLIISALEDKNCLGLIVMVQKEVALKFCSKAGESEFSTLGVLSSLICDCILLFEVAPEYFEPKPKVNSAVIFLDKKNQYDEFCEIGSFKIFLRQCFKAPRKQLLTNLKMYKYELIQILETLNFKETIRPHEIDAKSYLKIYEKLKETL